MTAIIEREMNGAPGLLYMSSSSDAAGNVSINLSFKQGTSPDLAAVEVQNRLKIVEERLPEVVRRNGIRIEKAAENYMMYLSLSAERGRFDGIDLGDLASSDLIHNCAVCRASAPRSCSMPNTPCVSGPMRTS